MALHQDAGAICRLVEERGICETLKGARPGHVEFEDLVVPEAFYPPGGSPRESWRTLFYANLVASWIDEILDPTRPGEGDFTDGAWVQEVINAVEESFRRRAWVEMEKMGSG